MTHLEILPSIHSRCMMDEDTAEEYAEILRSDQDLPPVTAFGERSPYVLADGFHTYRAHQLTGRKFIRCQVKLGNKSDALLYSLGANIKHGLRLSNDDKRRAVRLMLADPVLSIVMSARKIAEHLGVSNTLVSEIVNELKEIKQKQAQAQVDRIRQAQQQLISARAPFISTPISIRPTTTITQPTTKERIASIRRCEQLVSADLDKEIPRMALATINQARQMLLECGDDFDKAVCALDVALSEVIAKIG